MGAEAQSQLQFQFDPASVGQSECPPLMPCDPTKFEKTPKQKRSERSSNVMPPFGPIETSTRKSSSGALSVHPELLQPLRSFLGQCVFFFPNGNPQTHSLCCLVKFDSYATGKMHVATASKHERLCVRRLAFERCGQRSNNGQGFDQRSHFRACESVITMLPLGLDNEQFSVNQLRQMCNSSLGRDSRHKRQLACRQRTSVHQRNKHSGTRIVADQRTYARDLKFHAPIVHRHSQKRFDP